MSVGFEPTPMKTTALTLRLGPLGHDISCSLESCAYRHPAKSLMSVGFEPTPMKTTALTLRLGPLGHDIPIPDGEQ
jgi:hypothetical protein